MYVYDQFDRQFVLERAAQLRDQVARRLKGELTENEFRPLRLQNGVYLQLHAYMLRVAIPYGTLSSIQLHALADISETFDKGYGHFTTRQNIQFNWPELVDIPEILEKLADVEMHAIQTSGNCIRNVTSDPYAGVAADEYEDPRVYAEFIRQWSTLHPEFAFLPRKFKIAVTGAREDRAAIAFHDIGLRLKPNASGEIGFEIHAGGGMGRTPMIGHVVKDWLAKSELLDYLQAVMRVYNLYGRRDNKYKARIKILVHEIGVDQFKREVEEEYRKISAEDSAKRQIMDLKEIDRIAQFFAPPKLCPPSGTAPKNDETLKSADHLLWKTINLTPHRNPDYAIVNISLKPYGGIPGDASADEMRAVADIAKRFSLSEIRVAHTQNLVLPYVKKADLGALWRALQNAGIETPNSGQVTDIIACPGLDYCGLATARSIPIAQAISTRFKENGLEQEIGRVKIKISGCINACGHHHAGHIGILGLEKGGEEYYQITLGGNDADGAAIGSIIGPGFSFDEVPRVVEDIINKYLDIRLHGEEFIETYNRVGTEPFKEEIYATH